MQQQKQFYSQVPARSVLKVDQFFLKVSSRFDEFMFLRISEYLTMAYLANLFITFSFKSNICKVVFWLKLREMRKSIR